MVLTDVLHAQRSMLSTATGCTPHERMFSYRRKTTAGTSLPTWLRPGPVLVRRHVRGKYDPLVEDAELINANPTYATVRLQSGREIDVNIRDVAPLPDTQTDAQENTLSDTQSVDTSNVRSDRDETSNGQSELLTSSDSHFENADAADVELHEVDNSGGISWVRRSTRQHKPVQRYGASPSN